MSETAHKTANDTGINPTTDDGPIASPPPSDPTIPQPAPRPGPEGPIAS